MHRSGSLRRRHGRAGYRIGSRGLERTARADVVVGGIYAMGASSSPKLVEILSVAGDQIRYVGYGEHGNKSPVVVQRWIGEDLIARGEQTFHERYGVSAQTWIHMTEAERGAQLRKQHPGLYGRSRRR